ncbi:MAG: DUF4296 domain-containing protein [Flavobacteriales bacterium]
MKPIFYFILLLWLFACAENKVPDRILPLEQMSPLVEEITILETHYQSKFGVPSQYKNALDKSVSSVLKKANCTREKFKKSLQYYAAHPALQKALNDTLLTSLSRKLN